MTYEEILGQAHERALELGHPICLIEHVLLVLLKQDEVLEVLKTHSGDIDVAAINTILEKDLASYNKTTVSKVKNGSSVIRTFDMLHIDKKEVTSATAIQGLSVVLQVMSIDASDYPDKNVELRVALDLENLEKYIFALVLGKPVVTQEQREEETPSERNKRRLLETVKPTQERVAIFGKDDCFNELLNKVNANTGQVIILKGEAKSGKTTMIQHLANTIAEHDFEGACAGLPLNRTVTPRIANFDLNANMRNILMTAKRQDTILVVEDLHKYHTYTEQAAIMPLLIAAAEDGLRIICTTSPDYFEKTLNNAPNKQCLTDVEIPVATGADFESIIHSKFDELEEVYVIKADKSVRRALIQATHAHIKRDKLYVALRTTELAFSRAVLNSSTEISLEDIATAMQIQANVRDMTVQSNQAKNLESLSSQVSKVIYGQDEAISRIAGGIQVSSLGLKENAEAPRGVFMLLGSTGVGKTESATQFAKAMNREIITLDMSEYQESHTVSKILGAPAGYVGHADGDGILYSRLKKSPDAFILFDEIEKANPAIFKLLLGALDKGRLTTSTNKTIDLSDNFIFFTSNIGTVTHHSNGFGLGSNTASNKGESNDQARRVEYRDELYVKHFTPEFRSRIDTKIVFNPLDIESAIKIAHKSARAFIEKVKSTYGVTVTITEAVIKQVTDKHFAQADGARKIGFGFKDDVISEASQFILRSLSTGEKVSTIVIDCSEDKITFKAS